MIRNLIVKISMVVLAVVLLQLAVASDSQAQGYGGEGYGGGGGGFYYTVKYGDTLFAICRKFGVDPYQIAQANGLPNPDHIYAGQVLYIPAGSYCQNCGGWQPQPPRPQHPVGCYNNCYQQSGNWQGCGNNCNQQGCGNNCYQQSNWQQGCGNNCYQQGNWQQGCGNNCYQQGNQGCGNNCYQQSNWWQGCGNNCYQQRSGYDYTGYYYEGGSPNYQRYSYTCGYNYNCY